MNVTEALKELRKISWGMRETGNAIRAEAMSEDLLVIEYAFSELQAQVIRLTLGTHALHTTPVRGCLECFDALVKELGRTLRLARQHCTVHIHEATWKELEKHLRAHHRIEFGTDDCQLAQYAKGA